MNSQILKLLTRLNLLPRSRCLLRLHKDKYSTYFLSAGEGLIQARFELLMIPRVSQRQYFSVFIAGDLGVSLTSLLVRFLGPMGPLPFCHHAACFQVPGDNFDKRNLATSIVITQIANRSYSSIIFCCSLFYPFLYKTNINGNNSINHQGGHIQKVTFFASALCKC